jgi:hypothetical protein
MNKPFKHLIFSAFLGIIILFATSCKELETFIPEEEANAAVKELLQVSSDSAASQSQNTARMRADEATIIHFPQNEDLTNNIMNRIPDGEHELKEITEHINYEASLLAIELKPLFDDAINNTTYDDVYYLIESDECRASSLLKNRQEYVIKNLFKQLVQTRIINSHVNYEYITFQNSYNIIAGSKVLHTELHEYLIDKVCERYFYLIQLEEYNIRTQSSHQHSDLLTKVFGHK